MKRKLGILMGLVMLTLATSVSAVGPAVSTYCDGTCWPSGQHVIYHCGYGVGAPTCCRNAWLNACPNGEEFSGVCEETYGIFYC